MSTNIIKDNTMFRTSVAQGHGYTDLPTANDALNANNFCKGIATFIETCDTPMTIAIQGDWGTGKSTAIRLIEKQLELHNESHPEARIAYATLDTWQYSTLQQESLLPTYLLVSMYNSILECTNQGAQPEDVKMKNEELRKAIVEFLKKVAMGSAKGLLQFFGNYSGVGIGSNIGALLFNEYLGIDPATTPRESKQIDALEDNEPIKLPAELVKERIAQLIDQAILGSATTGPNTKNGAKKQIPKVERIVLFIDELDRLKPETAFELLEAMKNFFDCKHCVFVLAVDRDVVYRGIEIKYKGTTVSPQKKQQFFDKIIQLPFNLPTSQYSTPQYFEGLLRRYGTTPEQAETYNSLFVSILQTHNPRSIKRILNLWDLYQLIYANQEYDADSRQMLFGALVLQVKEEQDANVINTGKGPKPEKPYSDLVKAAQEGEGSLKDVLLRARNGNGPIHAFAKELGIYQDGKSNTPGNNKLDDTKVDTLQTLLTSLSEMFSANSNSTTDVGYGPSSNLALEQLRNYLLRCGCEENRVAKERYDYWKNNDRHTSINGTVSLRDNLQRKTRGKAPQPGDEVHIVFRFDTGEANAIPDYLSLQRVVKEILPEITNRQLMGIDGQQFATLTAVNSKNVDRVIRLLGQFLSIEQKPVESGVISS